MSASYPHKFEPEPMPPASARDIRRLLLGTVAGLLAFNAVMIWFLGSYSPNRTPRVTRIKWELLDRPPAGTDWLILGDSSGLRGVSPSRLDERLGSRSINLCTTRRMLAVADAWMLERYIERHGPPTGVLLVHVWEVWQGDRDWLVSAMPDVPLPWGFWNQVDPSMRLTPGEQSRLVLTRYVPIYADNTSVGQTFQYPWKVLRFLSSVGVDAAGFMPIDEAKPWKVDEDYQRSLEAIRGRQFAMSGLNRQALARIRELAEQHGFDVYLANSPLYEGLARHPEFERYFGRVQAALREFAATSPRLHYIAQTPWTFPRERMENCDHVTAEASGEYTDRLADEILRLKQ